MARLEPDARWFLFKTSRRFLCLTLEVVVMKLFMRGRAASYLSCLLIVSAIAGCGNSSGDAGNNSAAVTRLDACKILGNVGPDKILGEPTDAGMMLVESHTNYASSSQCQFAATGSDRTIGLLIQRVEGNKPPASRQAYLDAVRNANDLGVGDETAQALQAGREIAGLGDLALTYDLFTYNLMVWSGEHQFTVMLNGFGDGAEAESRVIATAKSVIAEL